MCRQIKTEIDRARERQRGRDRERESFLERYPTLSKYTEVDPPPEGSTESRAADV